MNRLIVTFLLLSFISFKVFSQNELKLEVITSEAYPIKIDGGCNFFALEDKELDSRNDIFIVSSDKIGFFKLNGKFIYVNHITRNKTTDGYIDKFTGAGYNAELTVKRIRTIGPGQTEVSGVLKLVKAQKTTSLKVHGRNEDGSL